MSAGAARYLAALSDPIALAIVMSLMGGPKTQKQLRMELAISSSMASRRMAVLERLRLVERITGHGPYSLVLPMLTADVLEAAIDLADTLEAAQWEGRPPIDHA